MSMLKLSDVDEIIEKLTTGGQEHLDSTILSQLTNYAKSQRDNEDLFHYIGRILLHQLKQNHAQIRYSTFLLINHFFIRSHLFRNFICHYLDKVFEFCLGFKNCKCVDDYRFETDGLSKQTLQPVLWSNKLRALTTDIYEKWYQQFKEKQPILKNGYTFLVDNKIIERNHNLEQSLTNVQPRNRNSHLNDRIAKLNEKFDELENDVNLLIIQIDSCFELLIPKFQITEDSSLNDALHFRPMQGLSFNIVLNTNVEIVYDHSNSDLIDNLKELCDELEKLNKKLKKFESEVLMLKDKEELLSKIRDLSIKAISIIWKFKEIKITKKECEISPEESSNNHSIDDNYDDNDSDDFEEVLEREDLYLLSRIEKDKRDKVSVEKPDSEKKELKDGSVQFHQCRALLPSGRLCPRRDLVNCPFHGKIVPRDEEGLPYDAELKQKELDERFERKANEWKDPKYLRELSKQTGKDLEGKNLRKRNKYPNLISVKELNSTPRKRLRKRFRKQLERTKLKEAPCADQ